MSDPDQVQPSQGPRNLTSEDRLNDDIATDPAIGLVDADTVESGLGHLVPKRERIALVLMLQFAGELLWHLGLDPTMNRVPKSDLFLFQQVVHYVSPIHRRRLHTRAART